MKAVFEKPTTFTEIQQCMEAFPPVRSVGRLLTIYDLLAFAQVVQSRGPDYTGADDDEIDFAIIKGVCYWSRNDSAAGAELFNAVCVKLRLNDDEAARYLAIAFCLRGVGEEQFNAGIVLNHTLTDPMELMWTAMAHRPPYNLIEQNRLAEDNPMQIVRIAPLMTDSNTVMNPREKMREELLVVRFKVEMSDKALREAEARRSISKEVQLLRKEYVQMFSQNSRLKIVRQFYGGSPGSVRVMSFTQHDTTISPSIANCTAVWMEDKVAEFHIREGEIYKDQDSDIIREMTTPESDDENCRQGGSQETTGLFDSETAMA